MTGGKALALDAWAAGKGRAYLRFDYGGCGASEGRFEDQTLAGWLADALPVEVALALALPGSPGPGAAALALLGLSNFRSQPNDRRSA